VIDLNGQVSGGTVSGTTVSYFRGSGSLHVTSPNLLITDVDSKELSMCIIQLDEPTADQSLDISVVGTLISKNYESKSGTMQLSGKAPLSDYSKVLRSLIYVNNASHFNISTIYVDFICYDDQSEASNVPYIPISLINVNNPPSVQLTAKTVTYYKQGAPIPIAQNASIVDPDSVSMNACYAYLLEFPDGSNEVLEAQPLLGSGISIAYDPLHANLTMSGPASVTEFETILSTLTYVNYAVNPTPGIRSIEIYCEDIEGDSLYNDPMLVNVIGKYPTIVDLSGPNIPGYNWVTSLNTSTESTPISNNVQIIENDALIDYCTISLPRMASAGEGFYATPTSDNISYIWQPENGVLFITGPASPVDFQNFISTVEYVRLSEPTDYELQVSVQCVDLLGNLGEVSTTTIYIDRMPPCEVVETTEEEHGSNLSDLISEYYSHLSTPGKWSFVSYFTSTSTSSSTTSTEVEEPEQHKTTPNTN